MPDTVLNFDASVNLDTSNVLKQLRDLERRAVFNIKLGNTQPLGALTGKVSEFDKSLQAANARVLAFGASVGVIGSVTRAIEEMVTQSLKLSKVLSDINALLNAPSAQIKQFGNDLFEAAKKTGQSFDSAALAAKEFARQGLSAPEILKRTSDALLLTRLSGLEVEKSITSLTAIFNTFQDQVKDTTDIVNRFANVDAKFAVSSGDFAEAFARVGSTAQDAKVGFNELIAVVTSLKQTTGREASVIGNSLKSIFTRIERSGTIEQLEELGVGVRNLKGETLPAIQVLTNLANRLTTASDAQKAFITQLVGGGFQINQLKALLSDLSSKNSVYSQALQVANTTTTESIDRNNLLNQSFAALANSAQLNFQKVAGAIGQNAIQPALENIFKLINEFSDLISNGPLSKVGGAFAKGIGSVIAGPGLIVGIRVITKLFQDFATFSLTAGNSFLGIGQATDNVRKNQLAINALLREDEALKIAIESTTISQAEKEALVNQRIAQRLALQKESLAITEQLGRAALEAGFFSSNEGAFISGPASKTANTAAVLNNVANNSFSGGSNSGGAGNSRFAGINRSSGSQLSSTFNFEQLNNKELLQVAADSGFPVDDKFFNYTPKKKRVALRDYLDNVVFNRKEIFRKGLGLPGVSGLIGGERNTDESARLQESLKRGGLTNSSFQDRLAELKETSVARKTFGLNLAQLREAQDAGAAIGIPLGPDFLTTDPFGPLPLTAPPKTNRNLLLRGKNFLRNAVFGDRSTPEAVARSQAFSQGAFKIGIGASLLGGAASAFISNPQAQRATEGIGTGIGVGATVASLAGGPVGIIVGATVGAFIALKSAIDNLTPSVKDVQENFAKTNAILDGRVQAASSGLQIGKQLRDSNLSSLDKDSLNTQFLSIIGKLPRNVQDKFIGGNDDVRQKILNNFSSDEARSDSSQKAALLIKGLASSRDFTSKLNPFLSPINLDSSQRNDITDQLLGGSNKKIFSQSTASFSQGLDSGLTKFRNVNRLVDKKAAFVNLLQNQFGFDEKQANQFVGSVTKSGASDLSNIKALTQVADGLGDKGLEGFRRRKKVIDELNKSTQEAVIVSKQLFQIFQSGSTLERNVARAGLSREFNLSNSESSANFGLSTRNLQRNQLRAVFGNAKDKDFSEFEGGLDRLFIDRTNAINSNQTTFDNSQDAAKLAFRSLGEKATDKLSSFANPTLRKSLRNAAQSAAQGNTNAFDNIQNDLLKVASGDNKKEADVAIELLKEQRKALGDLEDAGTKFSNTQKQINQNYEQGKQTLELQLKIAKDAGFVDFFKKFNPTKPFDASAIQAGNTARQGNIIRRFDPDFNFNTKFAIEQGGRNNANTANGRALAGLDIRDREVAANSPVLKGLISQFENGIIPSNDLLSGIANKGSNSFGLVSKLSGFRNSKIDELSSLIGQSRNSQLTSSLGDAVNPFLSNLSKFTLPGRGASSGLLDDIRIDQRSGNTDKLRSDLFDRLGPSLNPQGRAALRGVGGEIDTIGVQIKANKEIAKEIAEDIANGGTKPLTEKTYQERMTALIEAVVKVETAVKNPTKAAIEANSDNTSSDTKTSATIDINVNGENIKVDPQSLNDIILDKITAQLTPFIAKLNPLLIKDGQLPFANVG